MKLMTFLALTATLLFFASCGLSQKQKLAIQQAQQAKDDSIHMAQLQQAKDEKALRSAITDSLTYYSALLARQQTGMVQVRTAVYTANDEMTQIKGFHIGRLPRDRETQIQNQELKIQLLLVQQASLQTAIEGSMQQLSQLRFALAAASK